MPLTDSRLARSQYEGVRGGTFCALTAIACGGCDVIFRLDDVRGAGNDASNVVSCEQDHHDEDGDRFADSCDRCPGIADDQADHDGDGLGDACDPSSTTRDQVALFMSFANSAEDWRLLNGNWFGDGENLVYDSVSLASYGNTLYAGVPPEPPFVIEYHYIVDSIDTVASSLAVVIDADPNGKGVVCGHVRYEAPLRDVVKITYQQAVVAGETEIMTVTPGGYRMRVTYDRTQISCAIVSDDATTSGGTTLELPTPPAAGALGFRSLKVGVHIQYVAIYKPY